MKRAARLPLFNIGFNSWGGSVALMSRPHRHNEIELNLIEQGYMTYVFGGQSVIVRAGTLALFWAAFPHQVIQVGEPTTAHWLTLPLRQFLAWQLYKPFTESVLNNQVIVAPNTPPSDLLLFRQWHQDFKGASEEQRKIVLLEVEARIRRLALTRHVEPEQQSESASLPLQRVGQIANVIAQHYVEPLTVPAIAGAVGLHPAYAMTIFREHYHMSILECLTQY
ncbi:MAG: AraC family ligand binding domain-containing protein, partial [Anaerolineae bacterium]|nr:AraC family ligand binding domain-containing protein [Anaerolineae bacterium]